MNKPDIPDARVIVAYPPAATDSVAFSPFDWPEPSELVFVAFVRDEQQRSLLLLALKDTAAHAARDGADAAALGREYATLAAGGPGTSALLHVIAWRAASQQALHTYNLRVGFAPYGTSCLIAFRELSATELRDCVERAMRHIRRDKARVLDTFGLGHYLPEEEEEE